MSTTLSPNMLLPIPTVGSEPGPDYAFDVNTALTLVDQHNHTPGSGVQITPDGLNINANLDFQNNNLINVNTILMLSQLSVTTPSSLYVAPGGEIVPVADLFFNDGSGVPIQITKGGIVNTTASSIPGESYSAGTFIWKQTQSGAPTTPANFDIGSVTIRPNTALTAYGVTLSPPSTIASSYTITQPTDPGLLSNTAFMTLTSAGIIQTGVSTVQGIITTMIADGNVTAAKLSAGVLAGTNWMSQTFTADGNFTVPANINQVFVVGAGGGGGGGCGGPSVSFGGGNGGAGANPSMYIQAVTPLSIMPVVIGTGGAGSFSAGGKGGDGSPSTIGNLNFAGGVGGGGGTNTPRNNFFPGTAFCVYGGYGGIDTNGNGGNPSIGTSAGAAGGTGTGGGGGGGGGGGSGFAVGGVGGAATGAGGNPGTAAAANSSGGGGGGGGPGGVGSPGAGGNGGSGMVIVYWQPGAT